MLFILKIQSKKDDVVIVVKNGLWRFVKINNYALRITNYALNLHNAQFIIANIVEFAVVK